MSRPKVGSPRWHKWADEMESELSMRGIEEVALSSEIKFLRGLLTERDGGSHDATCKIYNPKIQTCNCGHKEVRRYLEGEGH